MPPRPRRKPKPTALLSDRLGPSLEERCRAHLVRSLPPDATEFERVCFEGMANYLNLLDELRTKMIKRAETD